MMSYCEQKANELEVSRKTETSSLFTTNNMPAFLASDICEKVVSETTKKVHNIDVNGLLPNR